MEAAERSASSKYRENTVSFRTCLRLRISRTGHIWIIIEAISAWWLVVTGAGRAPVVSSIRRRRCASIGLSLDDGHPRAHGRHLLSSRLLRCLSGLAQGIHYLLCDFESENGSRLHRARHRLPPCLQGFVQLFAHISVYQRVCVHKRIVKISSKIDRVGRPYILHNRVEDVNGRKLLSW